MGMARAKTPAEAARSAEVRAEMMAAFAAERATFTPMACACGRGFVTTVFGCGACKAEEATRFMAVMVAEDAARFGPDRKKR